MITQILADSPLRWNPNGSTTLDTYHDPIERVMAESIVADPPETKPAEDDLDPRVLKGVLYLDEHYPGWANRINLRTFDLSQSENCVVGQLMGSYAVNNVAKCFGVENLPTDTVERRLAVWKVGAAYGTLIDDNNLLNTDTTYTALEEDWRKAIKARQRR